MKGRLVAAGNEVDPSVYTRDDTSSPTVRNLSMMAILSAASFHRADIGAIDFRYSRRPQIHVAREGCDGCTCCRLPILEALRQVQWDYDGPCGRCSIWVC
jgi:ferredoxin-like protein FixX